jgi:peptide/nickel transport system permease protein
LAEMPTLNQLSSPLPSVSRRSRLSWNWLRWPSVWLLAALITLSILAPVISPYSPVQPDLFNKLLPPSRDHWFGTDPLGMDVFTRILYATRTDLTAAIASVVLGIVWGIPLGALSAYAGGTTDRILTRVAESVQAFPQILFGMALFAALGSNIVNLVLILAFLNFPVYLMMVRSVALPLRDSDFVLAARCAGVPTARLILRYIVPNALVPVFSQFPLSCAFAVQMIAGLSFIGLGVKVPAPEWGAMINLGANYIVFGDWWPSVFPGLAVFLSVFALSGLAAESKKILLRGG